MTTLENYQATLPRELRIYETGMEVSHGMLWLRNVLQAAGRSKLVLGLSGGLDSATVAYWAAKAIGSENVLCIALPYGHAKKGILASSTEESVAHAQLVADRLGLELRILDITSAVDAELCESGLRDEIDEARRAADHDRLPALELAAANLKARIRAVRLRTMANRVTGLLIGTENATENELGYFTIGGDEESDLEMLAGYLKSQVRQIAYYLGVPSEIIEKAPSADLWAGQTDEDELGFTYAQADLALYYTNGTAATARHLRANADSVRSNRMVAEPLPADFNDFAKKVLARRSATAFKRASKPTYIPVNRMRYTS